MRATTRRGLPVFVRGAAMALALVFAASPVAAAPGSSGLQKVRKELARSRYDDARKALAALGPQRNKPEALLLKTRVELWTGEYAEAVKTARRASRAGKKWKIAVAPWQAEALVRQGKIDKAIKVLRAVESETDAHRARVLLGELLISIGQRSAADGPLRQLVQDYNQDIITDSDAAGLTLVGRAAHLMRSARDANTAYKEAEKAGGKKRVETLLCRADLFLDKYDPGHAAEVVKEALALAPNDPRVHVAMAHVRLAQAMDFTEAEEEIDKALKVDPNLAEAFYVRAGLAIRTMDLDGAMKAADAGLKHNPRNLELLSIKAATRFLAEDLAGYEALKQQVLGLNPQYSRFFQIVAEFAEWEHRYDDIIAMMREAITIDGQDSKAYATLGLNLIRNGDETTGLEELRKAWRRDKFNVRVFNTLNLFEDTIDKEYVTTDGSVFRIRYHKKEQAILERYVPQMLDEAWGSMVKRYSFTPTRPVGIELYADNEHFSVRTSGLPNIGIQGVCFGKTLAAMSPAAAPFNWGMVVWHELGHVFAIQLSKNRVPRWFTEGMSEYETIIRRPEWQREEWLQLYQGLRHKKIPKIADFNRAFTHPERMEDVTMGYFAASQIMVFFAQEFGFDKAVNALRLWGAGKPSEQVVQEAFGQSAAELDRRFHAWLEPKLAYYEKQFVPDLRPPKSIEKARAAVAANPQDAATLVKLALALLSEGKGDEGKATLGLALQKDPKNPEARYIKLQLLLGTKAFDEAQALAEQMIADGHDGYAVRMKAADLAELKKDKEKQEKHLWAAHRLDPTQAEPLQALYDAAHKAKDEDGELDTLRQLAKLDQHDRRVWVRLLRILVKRGKWQEASSVGESAMYVAVADPEVHRLYAKALARSGRFVSAMYELNSAIIAGAKPSEAAAIYRTMAEGYQKLGRDEYAQKALEYAKQMDGEAQKAPPPSEDKPGGSLLDR